MNATKQLESLQAFINKEFSSSPSPLMQWTKPVVLSVERGKLAFQYIVRREMTNPIGTLHGGVTAAIMDDTIGATMYSLDEDYFYTTINNVIDYFATAREGDVIIAETQLIKQGRQIINAQCEIWNEGHTRLLARGYSNLLKTDIKRP